MAGGALSVTSPRPGPARPYLVGLTGGIASGKSTVAGAFRRLGITVIDADVVSRQVVEPGSPLLAALADRFGSAILDPDGRLNRARLRALVFSDAATLAALNSLTHPVIRARLLADAAAADGPYVLLEVPLLVEGGLSREVDRVLVVDCDEARQRERVVARDGSGPAEVDAILKAQASRAARLAAADDVVENSGSLADLDVAVADLDRRYRALAAGAAAG